MKRGARIGDKHKCPQQAPVPHVGGLVIGPGAPKVFLQHMVGCVEGDACACVGGPDTTAKASGTVWYQGKRAVRVGDLTAHGGEIEDNAGTVFVGD